MLLCRCQQALYHHHRVSYSRISIRQFSSSSSITLTHYIESIDNRTSIVFTNTSQREKPFYIDFVENAKRYEESPHLELVCKAVGKCNVVYDLTAGLGRDSLVLAMSGRSVIMFERNKVLYTLLDDALRRLASYRIEKQLPPLQLTLSNQDSTTSLDNDFFVYKDKSSGSSDSSSDIIRVDSNSFQVSQIQPSSSSSTEISKSTINNICVYLDPMYPSGTVGRKAQVKKETQVLHRLVGDAQGEDEENNRRLFLSAKKLLIEGGGSNLIHTNSRIVIKRPVRATPLLGLTPHSVIEGSTQRFDIYFANRLSSSSLLEL